MTGVLKFVVDGGRVLNPMLDLIWLKFWSSFVDSGQVFKPDTGFDITEVLQFFVDSKQVLNPILVLILLKFWNWLWYDWSSWLMVSKF